jgi:hypothetical protein
VATLPVTGGGILFVAGTDGNLLETDFDQPLVPEYCWWRYWSHLTLDLVDFFLV